MTTDIQFQLEGKTLGLTATGALVIQDPASGNTYQLTPAAGENVDLIAKAADLNHTSSSDAATKVGAIKAGVTGLAATIVRYNAFFNIKFTFTAMPVTHTDAAGAGSSGSQEIFDFAEAALLILGSRSDLVITADNVLDNGTTLAGVYAFGTVAATAHDGSLSGTEVNLQAASGTLTATAHVLTSATLLKGAGSTVDGTATAAKMFFNESMTAATSVANGTLLVTGTANFVGIFLGDD